MIERHKINQSVAQREFNFNYKEVTELVAELPSNPIVLEGVFDASYQLAAAASVVAPEKPILRYAIQTAAQAAAAMFALHDQHVCSRDLNYQGIIGNQVVDIEGYSPSFCLGPDSYQIGLYCSLISRDIPANREICLVPPWVIRHNYVAADEYQYEWITMLGRISNGENLTGTLNAIETETTPNRVKIAPFDHVEKTLWLARAAFAAYLGETAAFNDALENALIFHRKIWKKRPNTWLGYMSFGATAIACWAIDQGIDITIESEYMPHSLLFM